MKKLLAILLVVATLFCIVACGKDTDTTTTTANQNSDAITTTVGDTTTTTVGDKTTTTVEDTTTTTVEDTTTTTKKEETTTTTTKKVYVPTPIKGVDPTDSNNWKKVVNGVFTSDKGGLQIKAEGWKTYGLFSISYVPESYGGTGQTNAVCVSVYDADPADVFAAKTEADFETVLAADITSFEKTTVCGYPAYKAVVPNVYYVWVVNTPTHKYFINFMQAPLDGGGYPFASEAAAFMQTVEIFK